MRDGKVVVVTGATGGVGRATARAFAEKGARVALPARGREGLAAAAGDVRQAGGEALVGPGNLWAPVDGPHGRDFGAHGRFDGEAVSSSPQDWMSRNRNRVLAAAAAGGLGAAVTARLRRRG
ncbi:SDR family NAD(P)-dependent oxidoreductase [Streptomyces sp. NBC_00285]|uniref:SDR family NAD(P)-dependent oxidoreductase n=1 Tax=Streptomyces sp. NBC_00285 TaxID=2975700 RepID=UPI002E27F778|nr:SDR family NAD(P)-dependent oxidoreductase [Streptomyces sp. NBC_00285]